MLVLPNIARLGAAVAVREWLMAIGDMVYVSGGSMGYHTSSGSMIYSKRQEITRAGSNSTRYKNGSDPSSAATAESNMESDGTWGSTNYGTVLLTRLYKYGDYKCYNYKLCCNTSSISGQTISKIDIDIGTLAGTLTGYIAIYSGTQGEGYDGPYVNWSDLTSQPKVTVTTTGRQTLTISSSVTLGYYLHLFPYVSAPTVAYPQFASLDTGLYVEV